MRATVDRSARFLNRTGWKGDARLVATWLLVALFLFVVGRLLGPAFPAGYLVAPSLVLAALWPPLIRGWPQLLRASGHPGRLELLAAAALSAGVTWHLLGFVITRGVVVDSGDHQVMIARAEAFTNGLASGRWVRWTPALQGGDSLTDLYPYFANLVVAAIHLLRGTDQSFLESYSWFVLLAFWLRIFGVYYLARRFAGVAIASALALSSALEVGSNVWDGVWHGALFWGMVHSSVGLSLALIANAWQVDALRRGTPLRFAGTAFWIALTAFSHPLGILYAGVSTVSLGLAFALARRRQPAVFWATVASALGILLAAAWILPFAHGQKTLGFSNAVPGVSLSEWSEALTTGAVPTTSFAAWSGLVVLANCLALVSKRPALIACASCSFAFWMLPVYSAMVEVRLYSYFTQFLDGQHRRMFTVLKTVSIPATAWLCQRVVSRHATAGSLDVRSTLSRALLAGFLLFGPARAIVVGWGTLASSLAAQLPKPRESRNDRSHTGADYHAVIDWVRRARRDDPSPTPWRLAINWTKVRRHAAWAEGFDSGIPVVDYINASSNFLGIRPRELSAAGFQDWNIRFLITAKPEGKPFSEHLQQRLQAGPFTLWEFTDYDPRFVLAKDGVSIRNLQVRDDFIEFDVSGAPSSGVDVQVRSAWYPRWRASGSGSDVRRTPARAGALPKQDQLLVKVHDGRVRLSCDGWLPWQLPGGIGSAIGLLLLAALAPDRRRSRLERLGAQWSSKLREAARNLHGRLAKSQGWLVAAGLGACVLLLLWLRPASFHLLLAPPFGPGPDVVATRADGVRVPCKRRFAAGRIGCGDIASVKSALGSSPTTDDTWEYAKLWPAVRVELKAQGVTAELHFQRVRLDQRELRLEVQTTGPINLQVSVPNHDFPTQRLSRSQQVSLSLPHSATSGPVQIRLTSASREATVHLRRLD